MLFLLSMLFSYQRNENVHFHPKGSISNVRIMYLRDTMTMTLLQWSMAWNYGNKTNKIPHHVDNVKVLTVLSNVFRIFHTFFSVEARFLVIKVCILM